MHKDPPPGLLERPAGVVVTYGLLAGFLLGLIVSAGWTFVSSVNARGRRAEAPRMHQPPR
jgi:hypothetical protein